ncbi:MAG: hypothetical protein Q8838_02730 [Candidatus Phytoplasma australasiaticum]|nr:hypothetical protein [Candidatus Phytoplasma australasiaticum]
MMVTTHGGKHTIDPPMPIDDDDARKEIVEVNDVKSGDGHAKDRVSDAIEMPLKL